MIERIRARRAELARQLETAQRQYNELETTLNALDRQLCAMHGGLQELDALLLEGEGEHISTYATGLNGAHAAALDGLE
jgi:chromosome segregation ATPase